MGRSKTYRGWEGGKIVVVRGITRHGHTWVYVCTGITFFCPTISNIISLLKTDIVHGVLNQCTSLSGPQWNLGQSAWLNKNLTDTPTVRSRSHELVRGWCQTDLWELNWELTYPRNLQDYGFIPENKKCSLSIDQFSVEQGEFEVRFIVQINLN